MKATPQQDSIHHFITGGPAGRQCTHKEVISNAQVAVLGGSDTALFTMNQRLRFLATNPAVQAKLRAELDTICNAGGELTVESTRKLPYLNGVLNEGLRLGNPAPIGVPVKTPHGGLQLGETYVPGNVEVKVPFRVTLKTLDGSPRGIASSLSAGLGKFLS
ncbi:cytochrome P450 [Aspergillus eucalypticola CBS 122712]|uniref:Cytochrome P450 n=1 Tax=Aspergillus eucalypticola (strain CBS 122712 / IBT 29274) TaxID=1448314 RepID=A0A317W4A4_ASPEC|nr:cytochrome P450 [Aspergillus eucalypticola CBS 122712]PWY79000.1 cytochrome P450 [Aspergillus eucalypticola CBS 122712]